VFQNLPQIPVSELSDMKIDDNLRVQGINLILPILLKFLIEMNIIYHTVFRQ